MNLDFLSVFEHFGAEQQSRKLVEEVYEFLHEVALFEAGVGDIKKITEEYCDIQLLMNEFKEYFEISQDEENDGVSQKYFRTKDRIRDGYYDK